MIHQFIRKNVRGRKKIVGVLVADMIDNQVCYGWSKVAVNRGDSFDVIYGINLATSRMNAIETVPIPSGIFKDAIKFSRRCRRYFKDANYDFKTIRKKKSISNALPPIELD